MALAILCNGLGAAAQTATSFFWRSDSLQISGVYNVAPNQYKTVGHHGPAIENEYFALRMYFNDSGSIDLYSKSGEQMELLKYLWYPTIAQQVYEGAGCDEYKVGRTVGCGGFSLWDGSKEVKLVAKSRSVNTGKTRNGSFIEMTAWGVPYKDTEVDIRVRIEAYVGKRVMKIIATELNGQKVQFLTGLNWHKGQDVAFGRNWICVWGKHPEDVSLNPAPVGAGLSFDAHVFAEPNQTGDMVRIISKPKSSVSTALICASVKEMELSTYATFREWVEWLF